MWNPHTQNIYICTIFNFPSFYLQKKRIYNVYIQSGKIQCGSINNSNATFKCISLASLWFSNMYFIYVLLVIQYIIGSLKNSSDDIWQMFEGYFCMLEIVEGSHSLTLSAFIPSFLAGELTLALAILPLLYLVVSLQWSPAQQ